MNLAIRRLIAVKSIVAKFMGRGDFKLMNDSSNSAMKNPLHVDVTIAAQVQGVSLGIVVARGIQIGPAQPALQDWCTTRVAGVLRNGMGGGESRREAVRAMIRAGGFKPAGRNKPAQEYLLRTITEQSRLQTILNAVDVLNVVSLESGLPISLLAASRLGTQAIVRYGHAGEQFVFNRSGQELDLEGLICICATEGPATIPLGTPIKDSMQGKVTESDRDVLAVLYAPSPNTSTDELGQWSEQLAVGLREFCQATTAVKAIA